MSKRKRARRDRNRESEFFVEALADATDLALDFIEEATPFEISSRLSELGVSTSHRFGIEEWVKRRNSWMTFSW